MIELQEKPKNYALEYASLCRDREKPLRTLYDELEVGKRMSQTIDEHHEQLLPKGLYKDNVAKPQIYNAVSACVGDDEITMTNLPVYPALKIAAASAILHLDISWNDVGVSHFAGNYAETYILTPLTRESGYSGTRSGLGSKAVPYILDPVKVKLLSPVRKQSEEDMDMASKFGAIVTSANWVHKDWISYTDQQIACVLATNVFDFRNERDFPFLFSSEGGCGGIPPFGQLETARNSLFHFNKGHSTKAILGIMSEAYKAHIGVIGNEDLTFLRAVHLVTHAPNRWAELTGKIRAAKETGATEMEIAAIFRMLKDDEPLPQELDEKAIEISPQDTYAGGIISYLRHREYIMTELDARAHMAAHTRVMAIKGDIPLATVNAQAEELRRKAIAQRYGVLSDLWKIAGDTEYFSRELSDLPDLSSDTVLSIMEHYYQTMVDVRIGSLAYTPHIRLFRKSDVMSVFDVNARQPLAESMFGREIELETFRFGHIPPLDPRKEEEEMILKWLDDHWTDEEELLSTIPRPIGVADPLLLHKIQKIHTENPESVVLMVTADQALFTRAKKIHPLTARMRPIDYISMCRKADELARGPKRKSSTSKFPNILTGNNSFLPLKVLETIRTNLYLNGDRRTLTLLYDLPNIERRLYGYDLGLTPHAFKEVNSGFLTKGAIANTTIPRLREENRAHSREVARHFAVRF